MGAARSMRRRAARSRVAAGNPGARSATSLFSPLTADLIGAMRPLLPDPDPAVAEFVVSDLLGACAGAAGRLGMLLGGEAEEAITDGIIDDLLERGSPAAHAALLALGAVGGDPVSRRARAAARRLRDRGVPGPAWADAVENPPRLLRAARVSDPYRDVDGLLLTFGRRGLGEQHMTVLVDNGLGGLAKDAVLLKGDRGLRGWLGHMAGLDVDEVEVRGAAGIVRRGMRLADACPAGPPIDDDYWSTRALLAAWLRHTPGVDSDTGTPLGSEAREELLDAFLTSPHGALVDGGGGDAAFIATTILDHGAEHGCGDPLRMSPRVVLTYMCDWFPRKVSAEGETLNHVPAVLEAWVRFAGDRQGRPAPLVEETVAMIHVATAEFLARSRDPQAFGMGKRIALAMRDDGVDVADPTAVNRWIAAFNQRDGAAQEAVLGLDMARL